MHILNIPAQTKHMLKTNFLQEKSKVKCHTQQKGKRKKKERPNRPTHPDSALISNVLQTTSTIEMRATSKCSISMVEDTRQKQWKAAAAVRKVIPQSNNPSPAEYGDSIPIYGMYFFHALAPLTKVQERERERERLGRCWVPN